MYKEEGEEDEINICSELVNSCEAFLKESSVDEGHGIDHIKAVLYHVDMALVEIPESELDEICRLAVKVAAILHDVDDHKFFSTSVDKLNEKMLLSPFKDRIERFIKENKDGQSQINSFDSFETIVRQMIDIVSCSSNGNSNKHNYPEWMLYPRIADRLEAIGDIGILRALQYGEYRNRVMYDDNTERVYTLEELNKVASPERFERYLAGNRSSTTIGHFYDKILHIGKPEGFGVKNNYFNKAAEERHKQVEEWVLQFWQNIALF